jgi:hypothetical protein
MFVYRSLALGLLGACCLLLAMRPPISVVSQCPGQVVLVSSPDATHQMECAPTQPEHSPPTIVDVAPGITSQQLPLLIVLAPGEQIAAIDDVAVASPLDAGIKLASIDLRSQRYIDLEIAGTHGTRRMLVLLH